MCWNKAKVANDGFVVLVFGVMRRMGGGVIHTKISFILGLFTYVSVEAVLSVLFCILFCVCVKIHFLLLTVCFVGNMAGI